MSNEVSFMLKKITFFNVILGALITLITYFFIGNYAFSFLLGILIAIINFFINGIVTDYLFSKTMCNSLLVLLSFGVRILLVCIVAILIIKINKYNFVPYVLGYTSQFIGLVIYGITIKND